MSETPRCKRDWMPIFEQVDCDFSRLTPELQEAYKGYKDLPDEPPKPALPKGYPGIRTTDEARREESLTEEQEWLKEGIISLARDIRKSCDPERVEHLEALVLEFNRKGVEPFTDDQVRDIIAQEEAARLARLEREIVITGHDLGYLTKRTIKALENWNQPPKLFRRAGGIVRITLDEAGRPIIDRADEFTVRWALVECADWFRQNKYDQVPAFPPLDVVRNLMREPTLALPPLRGTIEIPTLREDGSIILTPGYDERTGLFYAPDPDLVIPEVPDRPIRSEVKGAVELLQEIFTDFPFIDDASRTNTIATLITPILRPMIRGPVPLALFDKPSAGTGSSLLAEVVSLIVTGRDAAMMTAPTRDEEWAKQIAAVLIAGRSVAVFDNVDVVLKIAALASILTTSTYEGRLLGQPGVITLAHRTVWMAAGINLQLGGDMPRRCYWVRMDAHAAQPWKRTGFKHPELKDWVTANRGRIIAAILIICRSWVRAGAPLPTKIPIMGNFEAWSRAVGGILEHCGVPAFLGNMDEMCEETDNEGPVWEAFFERWYDIWGEKPVLVSVIADYLKNVDHVAPVEKQLLSVLPDVVADAWNQPGKFSRKLGSELAHRNGQMFYNGLRLEKGKSHNRYMTWIVKKVIK